LIRVADSVRLYSMMTGLFSSESASVSIRPALTCLAICVPA